MNFNIFFQLADLFFHQLQLFHFFFNLFFQIFNIILIFLSLFFLPLELLLEELAQVIVELQTPLNVFVLELLPPGDALQRGLIREGAEQVQVLRGEGAPDRRGGDLGGVAEIAFAVLDDFGATVSTDQAAAASQINPGKRNREINKE